MKKTALAALLTFNLAAGAVLGRLISPTRVQTTRGTSIRLVHAELFVSATPDGGTLVNYRACGYEEPLDGGARLGEPCWVGQLPKTVTEDVTRALLTSSK